MDASVGTFWLCESLLWHNIVWYRRIDKCRNYDNKNRTQLPMDKWSMRRKQQYSVFTAVFCRSSVNIEDMDTIKKLKKIKTRIKSNQLLSHRLQTLHYTKCRRKRRLSSNHSYSKANRRSVGSPVEPQSLAWKKKKETRRCTEDTWGSRFIERFDQQTRKARSFVGCLSKDDFIVNSREWLINTNKWIKHIQLFSSMAMSDDPNKQP